MTPIEVFSRLFFQQKLGQLCLQLSPIFDGI